MSDFTKKLTIILILGSSLVACSKHPDHAANEAAVATETAAADSQAIQDNAAKIRNNW